jgi:hypothetical protein
MKSKKHDPRIVFDSDSFGFDSLSNHRVRWDTVRRILCFKLDLLTTDEIRLRF